MAETALYTYHPIQPNQTRLFKFVQDGDGICVLLEPFSLEALPEYRALSYTWAPDGGRPRRNYEIDVNKRKIPILDTLRDFFQALGSRGMLLDGKWWWIDSICIDQANIKERAFHVENMEIFFRRAETVIAWLGEASSDSELAINFIKLLDETSQRRLSLADLRATLEQDHYRTHWEALTNFLSRRWWSRIWTVQEFVLAQSLSFWCGMHDVSRVAICQSLSMADKCTSSGTKESIAFKHGNNRRRAWYLYKASQEPGARIQFSLLALAAYFCCMDASDDRDRLFGVMGLATDQFLLQVDYSLRPEEVYARFTRSFIAHYKSLDVICFATTYTPRRGTIRPSWVPDWQKRSPEVIPSLTSQSSRSHIGNLRSPTFLDIDPSIYYSACKNREAVYAFEGSTLQVRGVIVDIIDGLAGSKQFEMVQSSDWNSTISSCCDDSPCSTAFLLESVCRSLVFDRQDRFLRYPMPTVAFLRDFLGILNRIITTLHEPVPRALLNWFEWVRSLQIHGRSFEDMLHDSFQANEDAPSPAPNMDEWHQDTFFGRFFDTVVRLSYRLLVTRSGRIGMVVEKAMKGDLVCVLYGCSVPVLLRKVSEGGSYTLVGECYLDGCMDGSLLDQAGIEESNFILQ